MITEVVVFFPSNPHRPELYLPIPKFDVMVYNLQIPHKETVIAPGMGLLVEIWTFTAKLLRFTVKCPIRQLAFVCSYTRAITRKRGVLVTVLFNSIPLMILGPWCHNVG